MRPAPSAPSSRIICLGNSWHPPDRAGRAVYERLFDQPLPPQIQLVDGGLGGLNLLPFLEDIETVVFVDSVSGFLDAPGLIVLELPSAEIDPGDFGHQASLGYLMSVAPEVLESPMPACFLVGIEGLASSSLLGLAARRSLELAAAGPGLELAPS